MPLAIRVFAPLLALALLACSSRESRAPDAGVDCSRAGCAPAPGCGEVCRDVCGCCGCGRGTVCMQGCSDGATDGPGADAGAGDAGDGPGDGASGKTSAPPVAE